MYLFLKRGEGREKEREKNIDWLPLTLMGIGQQPRHVPWPGIELGTFYFVGQHTTH